MSCADPFGAFATTLAQDFKLALKMDRILRRAQALNIDLRGTARRRLHDRAMLLVRCIDIHRGFLANVDLGSVDDHSALTTIDHLLARARVDAVTFSWALLPASPLDLEKEPDLDALLAVGMLLAESATVASSLVEVAKASGRRTSLPVSQLIARFGVRLLPWDERQRYLDEYLSELDELAQNSSRRAQLAHSLRLLVRAPALRLALRRAQVYAYRETR